MHVLNCDFKVPLHKEPTRLDREHVADLQLFNGLRVLKSDVDWHGHVYLRQHLILSL